MTAPELFDAVKQHAGYTTTGGRQNTARAATELRQVLKMQVGGDVSVKDRAMIGELIFG